MDRLAQWSLRLTVGMRLEARAHFISLRASGDIIQPLRKLASNGFEDAKYGFRFYLLRIRARQSYSHRRSQILNISDLAMRKDPVIGDGVAAVYFLGNPIILRPIHLCRRQHRSIELRQRILRFRFSLYLNHDKAEGL